MDRQRGDEIDFCMSISMKTSTSPNIDNNYKYQIFTVRIIL